jgi:hypothetical protein
LPISSNNEINVEDINAKLSGSSKKEIDSNRLSNDYRHFLSKRRNDLFNERNHKRKEENLRQWNIASKSHNELQKVFCRIWYTTLDLSDLIIKMT